VSGAPRVALVTGGAGFLGSHLCARLLGQGWRVLCVDNLATGEATNLAASIGHPQFRFLQHDITEPLETDEPLTWILHFASPASPRDYERLKIQTIKVGTLGTHNALGLARRHGARFLLASTSEVYGDPLVHPQPETYWGNVNPVGPRGVYDEAKRAAEAFTMAYHRAHDIDTRIARIFNSYGPRMRPGDGRAVPTFIACALRGDPLPVHGDGSQTRSLCYVDDLIDGVLRLMESAETLPVNIGNPHELTVLELANLIVELTGSQSKIAFHPLPQDDPKVRCPDITRARELLGWQPRIPLRDGLQRTIEWFRALHASLPLHQHPLGRQ
jgi:dTDP-glucose 4,6-dehydratase